MSKDESKTPEKGQPEPSKPPERPTKLIKEGDEQKPK